MFRIADTSERRGEWAWVFNLKGTVTLNPLFYNHKMENKERTEKEWKKLLWMYEELVKENERMLKIIKKQQEKLK